MRSRRSPRPGTSARVSRLCSSVRPYGQCLQSNKGFTGNSAEKIYLMQGVQYLHTVRVLKQNTLEFRLLNTTHTMLKF